MVGMAFKGPVYYVASEDLFSNGFVSKLIKFLVAPIPIKKSTTDVRAVLNCMQVAKEGKAIAIAPEGNRTYSGETGFIKPSIASLILALKLPVAFVRLEGGFGVHPRWSDVKRRGSMRAYVSRVMEPAEFTAMSEDEIYRAVKEELYNDDTKLNTLFTHRKCAEYLERAIYYCPKCGISKFESHGCEISCQKCGMTARYGNDMRLTSRDDAFTYVTVKDWYNAQSAYVNTLDLSAIDNTVITCDNAKLFEVIPYKKKIKLGTVKLSLSGKGINASGTNGLMLPFDDIYAVSVLGRNKLNIYVDDKIYQLKSTKRFNAVKYMNIYYRYTNVKKGDPYGEFLGI